MDNRTHETPAELAGLLEEIAVSLAEMAEARRVQLQLQFAPTPVWLQHETSQLRNNLRVFAENMILIAEAGSVIRIYMDTTDRQCIIEMLGNGRATGIDRLHAYFLDEENIFRTGLATAKKYVEDNDGELRYASHEHSGNHFRVKFNMR
ncbi:ATP-binding protein [Sediminibacterium ginsengisoli]|uniref:Histidine kinase-, DNA gyrase B-, and HSP90-like ATPase n=1 Tax=Sediminibacterium ginsengisoli TaxID=413434 RepID=A0A1T4N0E5_9BACT|nr:ATP-binding protein [Sediminibacterium ginsengisoli]SJZ72769.1 hypothetical protein SAMN04488132_10436 [Sediminibacterium ginsengisoli]